MPRSRARSNAAASSTASTAAARRRQDVERRLGGDAAPRINSALCELERGRLNRTRGIPDLTVSASSPSFRRVTANGRRFMGA